MSSRININSSEPAVHARRRFLQASLASVVMAPLAGKALAGVVVSDPSLAAGGHPALIAAKASLERLGARVSYTDVVAVADFGQASRMPRLHLVNIAGGRVESLLVAHGRGSDPAHTGWLQNFSNQPGSLATSQGAYLTGAYYSGRHGRSMRLEGLDPSNDNALERGIVIHAAPYVGLDAVREQGMVGRSEGCFAVSQTDIDSVLDRLAPGRLLIAAKL